MAATIVNSPYSAILDLNGIGLTLGQIYIGLPNEDPQSNPKPVYWDPALTIAAQQPLQVSAGYIMRTGTPSQAFTDGDYSIRVLDHLGVQVFYSPTGATAGGGSGADLDNATLVSGLTNAADDAAAATAGVPLGGLYRNGSVLQYRVA